MCPGGVRSPLGTHPALAVAAVRDGMAGIPAGLPIMYITWGNLAEG